MEEPRTCIKPLTAVSGWRAFSDGQSVQHTFTMNGDTAVFGFRVQTFVTRAHTAVIGGLGSGSPALLGVFDREGQPYQRPD